MESLNRSLTTPLTEIDGILKGAKFSTARNYRYTLVRIWDPDDPHKNSPHKIVSFVGLNPSTADETTDDPTVRRCINFAKSWGFDGMYMLNIFAYRATDPENMKATFSPISTPSNNRFIDRYTSMSDLTVICWGNHGEYQNRSEFVLTLIDDPVCLGCNKTGQPKHPLYLPADTIPRVYAPEAQVTEQEINDQWEVFCENNFS